MRRGATFSTLLHLAILLLAYFGVPSLFDSEETLDRPIPVTLYTVREETVLPPPQAPVKEAEVEPEPEAEPEKEAVPIPPAPDVVHEAPPKPPEPTPAKPEPAPQVAEAAAPPPPPPSIPEPSVLPPPPPPKPVNVAKVKPKKTPPLEPILEEKPTPPDALASLLKSVMESAQHAIKLDQKQANAKPIEAAPATMSRISDEPLSSSVSDAIRRQVEDNWNVPAGAADAANLSVEIRISLRSDGEVIRADIVDRSRLSETFYRTMAESARRAVLQASPLRDLPPEKYDQWREITFTFKPPV